jgi:hypothetical protein
MARRSIMAESDVANIIRVIESIDKIITIAEKNPKSFNIDSLRRSRDMAMKKLDESKTKYRDLLKSDQRGESVTLKAYRP